MIEWAGPQARRGAALFAVDGLAAAAAVCAAFWLRFDGHVPAAYLDALPAAVLLVAASRLACNAAASLHRWSFRLAGLPDALRVSTAGLAGTVAVVAIAPWLVHPGIPRGVVVLEFFLSTTVAGATRFGPRALFRWLALARTAPRSSRTLIIGGGRAAELL